MKKSEELRKKTRIMLAKNLIVLVVLAVVAFAGAFSWFSNSTTASANSVSVSTKASDALEFFIWDPSRSTGTISEGYAAINSMIAQHNQNNPSDPISWHTGSVDFDFDVEEDQFDAEFAFMKQLFLCEVTGDGKDFYSPSIKQNGDHAVVDEDALDTFSEAVANQDYLSFDIYFRSDKQFEIVLENDSAITPQDINPDNDSHYLAGQHEYDAEDDDDKEAVKSAAIGAVRLSVVNAGDRELLWIPGPNVWFNGISEKLYTGLSADGENNYNYGPDKGGVYLNNNTLSIRSGESTIDHAYYSSDGEDPPSLERNILTEDSAEDLRVSKSPNYLLGASSADDVSVCKLQTSIGDYYVSRIRVNLWLEGEDAEARLALVDGKFDLNLNFDIVPGSDS